MNQQNQLIHNLYNYDGKDKYLRKILEELSELSAAVCHYEDGKIHHYDLAKEIADVEFQLAKLKYYLKNQKKISDIDITICEITKEIEQGILESLR